MLTFCGVVDGSVSNQVQIKPGAECLLRFGWENALNLSMYFFSKALYIVPFSRSVHVASHFLPQILRLSSLRGSHVDRPPTLVTLVALEGRLFALLSHPESHRRCKMTTTT